MEQWPEAEKEAFRRKAADALLKSADAELSELAQLEPELERSGLSARTAAVVLVVAILVLVGTISAVVMLVPS